MKSKEQIANDNFVQLNNNYYNKHDYNSTCNKYLLKDVISLKGMAGALWTETVRTADQMDSMIYPRLLALAERAWHKAPWEDLKDESERNKKRTEDWGKFANALGHRELARLDKMGVKYYVPPPGARFVSTL